MTSVAIRYGLSDVGLAKICRSLFIPLPSRDYWARIKAGRTMKRVPLPPLKEESKRLIPNLVKLSNDKIETNEKSRKEPAEVRKALAAVPMPTGQIEIHPLVKAASKRLRQRDD